MHHTKSYIKGHPRPQFTRNSFKLLNGEWDFCFANVNDEEKVFLNEFPAKYKIVLPYSYQSPSSKINIQERYDSVWYKKVFDFSQEKSGNKRVILHFEGADYKTRVWVNGQFLGQNIGGYIRFSFDITNLLNNGVAQIIVNCQDGYSCTQARGKQKWEKEVFGCFYTETTGIWKSVWAEFVNEKYIEEVKIHTDTAKNYVQFDYTVPNICDNLKLRTTVWFNGRMIAQEECAVLRNNFSRKIDLTADVDPFKRCLWFPHSPLLYDVEFVLIEDGEEIDKALSYFGLVKYSTQNDNITVTDYPVYLKMILDQGYFSGGWLTPTEEQIVKDVLLIKELGFNGARKHQKIEDELFYYYCDILGVYVWLEMPSHYEFNDDAVRNFYDQWPKILKQYQNHPSIMALVPFNESWGIQRVFSDVDQQRFTVGAYYLTKTLLPDKLVISNDGWEHTQSDIVTLHHYAENGEQLDEVYGDLSAAISNEKTLGYPHKFAFANGYKYQGQPIILSEFGGIAFQRDKDKGWGYGYMVKDEDEYLQRLNSLIESIRKNNKISGYCFTQLTDVQQEINGLCDFDRNFKIDKKKLIEIFSK